MTKLKSDILEVIASSQIPMSREDIQQDAQIWPLHRGERLRPVTLDAVEAILLRLIAENKVELVDSGYRIKRPVEVVKDDKQLQLF